MMDFEKAPEENKDGAAMEALQRYWEERLEQFEEIIYPVFYRRGYSKNTALMACMMDELDDSLVVAAAAARGIKT